MAGHRNKPFIYLASASARRIAYLEKLPFPYRRVRSRYVEKHHERLRPSVLARRHARCKAGEAFLPKKALWYDHELVLGADTVVYFRGKVLGKPVSYEAAVHTLMAMSGKNHDVYTGIALYQPSTGRICDCYVRTRVRFKRWSRVQMESYVRKIHALDKAGGYAIQEKPCIVESYEGSLSNVVGLPFKETRELIRKMIRRPS